MKTLGKLKANIGIYAVYGKFIIIKFLKFCEYSHEIKVNKDYYLEKMQEFTKITLLEN